MWKYLDQARSRWHGQRAVEFLDLPLLPTGRVPWAHFYTAIPLSMACSFGWPAAQTGRVSYTFSYSLPALRLSTASHTKVSPVPPPLKSSCIACLPLFWFCFFFSCPFPGVQAGSMEPCKWVTPEAGRRDLTVICRMARPGFFTALLYGKLGGKGLIPHLQS